MRGYRLVAAFFSHGQAGAGTTAEQTFVRRGPLRVATRSASTHARPERRHRGATGLVGDQAAADAAMNASVSSGATATPPPEATRIRGTSVSGSIAASTGRPAARIE